MTILSKRLQQGVFAGLASQNRAGGSGGGGGFTVMQPLVNGGTQTGGPIAGVAGPPTGLSGAGGEKTLTTGTFVLPRAGWVRCEAICSDYVVAAGAHVSAHPVYFQVDGTNDPNAYGFIPVWAAADAQIRSLTTTILLVIQLQQGAHTVKVIWNSEEGANDTCTNANNPLYVFQLGF